MSDDEEDTPETPVTKAGYIKNELYKRASFIVLHRRSYRKFLYQIAEPFVGPESANIIIKQSIAQLASQEDFKPKQHDTDAIFRKVFSIMIQYLPQRYPEGPGPQGERRA